MAISCSTDDDARRDTADYFREKLVASMSYKDIVKNFGQPDEDRGSGIHMYVYKLSDNTEIVIGFTDKILYARHVDANALSVLEELL